MFFNLYSQYPDLLKAAFNQSLVVSSYQTSVFNFLLSGRPASLEEKLKRNALKDFPYNSIFSLPEKVTFCLIILPEIALIWAFA